MAEKAPELLLGRPIRVEHMEDLLGPARPPRMPLNLAGKLKEEQEGLKREIRTKGVDRLVCMTIGYMGTQSAMILSYI